MKKFITFIPRQPEGKLNAQRYLAMDNQMLAYDKQTRFPLIPMLYGYAEPGEAVQVIAVCENYSNSKFNLEYLKQELAELQTEQHLNLDLKVLEVPYDDGFEAQLETFQKLIDEIEDNDVLFACITYGSKPVPIVQTMALRYARFARKNTAIRCVAYGQFDHNTKEARIYDVTALLQIDDILRQLAGSDTADVRASIKRILAL